MKIGVVTFWTGIDNYGQILQAYALQRFLRNKGHDAFVIRYKSIAHRGFVWWLKLPFKILYIIYLIFFNRNVLYLHLKFEKQKRISEYENRKYPRNFHLFKERYIHFSKKTYNQDSIMIDPPMAEIYIAGSDQIWGGLDPIYYLQFAPITSKRIAYAPSFGGIKLNNKRKKILKRYLESFSVLGIREKDGVDLCKDLGREDSFLAIDPTLLLSKEDYSEISVAESDNSDYLFLYLLGNDMDFDLSKIYAWAKARRLKIKYVASQGQVDSYEKIYPNVDEWLGIIKNAKYVVTNSFHGTVFSLIMNKKFMVIPLSGAFSRMNGRVVDLLTELDLNDHIYSSDLNVLLEDIDFSKLNDKISCKREEISLMFDKWLA